MCHGLSPGLRRFNGGGLGLTSCQTAHELESGWRTSYLLILWVVVAMAILLLQQVNLSICTFSFGMGVKGSLIVGGAPIMHNISSLGRAGHFASR